MGLVYFKPMTFAGLRYFLAFLLFLPLMVNQRGTKNNLTRTHWIQLFLMGLCAYTIGNGALFWGLKYLPATTASLLHNVIPLAVLFLGILWLKEMPRWWQVLGLVATLGGSALFFSSGLRGREPLAMGIVCLGFLAFALFGTLSRKIAKEGCVSIIPLTAIPLGFGGGLLLFLGLTVEGMFSLSLTGWAIVIWLTVINTILAYLLYYHSLRLLTAFELHVLLNLSPLGTALFASLLLDEYLSAAQILGMVIVVLGVSLVQWRREKVRAGVKRIGKE
jgi:drug/metabolite transporter (DMT)-like permease